MTTIPIRTDVPLSLHPDVLLPQRDALEVDGSPGRAAYSIAREALGAMYEGYAKLEDAERALHEAAPPPSSANTAMGDNGRVVRQHGREVDLAEAATTSFERVARVVDARLATLRKTREELARRVESALAEPSLASTTGAAIASETRSFLRSLDPGKRTTTLADAVTSGDKGTVAAVLGAPLFLSGLTAEQGAALREQAARRFAPRDDAQLRAVDAAMNSVMGASTSFVDRYMKALRQKDSPRGKARESLRALAS